MAKKALPKGAQSVNRWRKERGVTVQAIAEAVGDEGGQIVKWLNGSRPRLPIKLKVAIARHTGLPIAQLCDADELKLARDLFALLARDTAGEAA